MEAQTIAMLVNLYKPVKKTDTGDTKKNNFNFKASVQAPTQKSWPAKLAIFGKVNFLNNSC